MCLSAFLDPIMYLQISKKSTMALVLCRPEASLKKRAKRFREIKVTIKAF